MDKFADRIYYTEGYKYKTDTERSRSLPIHTMYGEIETQFLSLDKEGLLTIKKGYAWDGASGAVDTDTNMRASLFHDALCQLINDALLPRLYQVVADQVFYDICLEAGMTKLRAWYHHRGVRAYAKSGLKKYEPKKVLFAP